MNRCALLVLLGATLPVPAVSQEAPSPRAFVAGAGMGVNALRAPDLVDVASSTNGARVDAFTSAAEFFAFATVPLAGVWALGVEYAYLVGGYRVRSGFGAGEYGFRAHLPSVLLHYSLVEEPAYSVRAGGGVGYHAASVTVEFPGIRETYSGGGPGFLLDLRGHTALGDRMYALLGVHLRWDAIGELQDGAGRAMPVRSGEPPPTFTFFSAGAKLGISFHL